MHITGSIRDRALGYEDIVCGWNCLDQHCVGVGLQVHIIGNWLSMEKPCCTVSAVYTACQYQNWSHKTSLGVRDQAKSQSDISKN
jgi:hypothetical protein